MLAIGQVMVVVRLGIQFLQVAICRQLHEFMTVIVVVGMIQSVMGQQRGYFGRVLFCVLLHLVSTRARALFMQISVARGMIFTGVLS
jgi:hypothetical protein